VKELTFAVLTEAPHLAIVPGIPTSAAGVDVLLPVAYAETTVGIASTNLRWLPADHCASIVTLCFRRAFKEVSLGSFLLDEELSESDLERIASWKRAGVRGPRNHLILGVHDDGRLYCSAGEIKTMRPLQGGRGCSAFEMVDCFPLGLSPHPKQGPSQTITVKPPDFFDLPRRLAEATR
jgi:hypothetical protein